VNYLPEQYRKLYVQSVLLGEPDKISLCIAKDLLKNIEKFYQEYLWANTPKKVKRAYSRILKYGPLKIETGERSKVKGFECHITAIGTTHRGLLDLAYLEDKNFRRIRLRFCERLGIQVLKISGLDLCLPYNKIPFETAFPIRMRNLASAQAYERMHRSVDDN
jgi:hypothetical protein